MGTSVVDPPPLDKSQTYCYLDGVPLPDLPTRELISPTGGLRVATDPTA